MISIMPDVAGAGARLPEIPGGVGEAQPCPVVLVPGRAKHKEGATMVSTSVTRKAITNFHTLLPLSIRYLVQVFIFYATSPGNAAVDEATECSDTAFTKGGGND